MNRVLAVIRHDIVSITRDSIMVNVVVMMLVLAAAASTLRHMGLYPEWWHNTQLLLLITYMPGMGYLFAMLIVDDDRELVEGLRAVLERQGYRIMQAHDGHQGKQAIYTQQPDLVILDMMMPRMGGYPVLEHFRGKGDAPPIIMITANEGSRHKAYAEYLGVIDYIRKPFAMERLLDAVGKALNPQKAGEAKAE